MNTFSPPAQTSSTILPRYAYAEGPRPGESADAPAPVFRLGNIVRRRWALILVFALLTPGIAGSLALRLPPVYTAKGQILVTTSSTQGKGGPADETGTAIETEVSTISSRDLLNRVFDHLVTTPGFPVTAFAQEGKLQQLTRWLVGQLDGNGVGAWIEQHATPEQFAALRALADPPNPRRRHELMLDEVERNFKANSETRSRVISVRFTAQSPEVAALIVNSVIKAYINEQEEQKRDGIRGELDRLDRHLPQLRAEVEAANAAIRAFRLENAVLDPASAEQQEQQAIVLKGLVDAAEANRAAVGAERAAMAELRAGPRVAPVATRSSTILGPLQEQERSLLAARASATVANDDAAAAERERLLRGLRERIVAEIDRADALAAQEAAMLDQRSQAFKRQLGTLQGGLRDLQSAADHLRQLQRLADAKREVYEAELIDQQKLLQSQDLVASAAAVLAGAAPPQKPTSVNPVLFLPPALVVGLVLGGVAAIWREQRDTTLRNERAILGSLGVPCAGFVPRRPRWAWQRRSARRRSLHAAALRAVFVATLCPPPSRHTLRTVLVTSSVTGEDSAELARDFAGYAARVLPRVLLINLDIGNAAALRRPTRRMRGDALPLESPWSARVPGTVLTRPDCDLPLDVLSVERRTVDPVAFLIGSDLTQMLRRQHEDYDCIVIHAGPVLEAVEAQLLAGEVDHILFAVRWGHTRRSVVENALSVLGRTSSPAGKPWSLSAVLTKVDVRRHLTFRFDDPTEAMARAHRQGLVV